MDDMVFQTENNNLTNDNIADNNDTSKENNYFSTEENTDQPYLISKMENTDLVVHYFIFSTSTKSFVLIFFFIVCLLWF